MDRHRLISVILPFRDEEAFLEACLLSLARQKEVAFELIGIDDGSSDRSAEIFHELTPLFDRAKYLTTGGAGLVEALNLGVLGAEGSILARADGDDIYHPLRLHSQLECLNRSRADIVGTLTRFFPRSAVQGGFLTYEAWINGLATHAAMTREIFVENPIPHPSLMMTRELFDKIGGYRDMDWPEDWDLILRAHAKGARLEKAAAVLHFWREHADRLCRVDRAYDQRAFIRCRCHHLARGPLARRRNVFIWGAGPLGRKTVTALREEKISVDGFIDIDPRKIGRVVRDRKVYAPSFLEKHRPLVLGCVGKRGARYEIRQALRSMGYEEEKDFLLIA